MLDARHSSECGAGSWEQNSAEAEEVLNVLAADRTRNLEVAGAFGSFAVRGTEAVFEIVPKTAQQTCQGKEVRPVGVWD